MDKVIKNKRGLEIITSPSSGHETSSEKFLYLLCIIWPSLMMSWKAVSELFQKLHLQIYACQIMTSSIIPDTFVVLNLESVERKRKNSQRFEKDCHILDLTFCPLFGMSTIGRFHCILYLYSHCQSCFS